jgi:hypothetical protein
MIAVHGNAISEAQRRLIWTSTVEVFGMGSMAASDESPMA